MRRTGAIVSTGVGIGRDVAQRHVEEFGTRFRNDVAAGGDELAEAFRRHEIFVQYVGAPHVLLREIGHRLRHQRIACRPSARHRGTDPRLHEPAQAFCNFPTRLCAINLALQARQLAPARRRRQQGRLIRGRAVSHHQRVVEEGLARHRHAAIGHDQRLVVVDGAGEAFGEFLRRHPFEFRLQQHVRRHLDVELDDDSEQAVAAHREREQFGILGARALQQRAIRHHHADCLHGRSERAVRHRPAMGVDAERAADAEIAVGLHDRRREALGIEHADHVPPAIGGGGAIGLRRRIDLQRAAVEADRGAVAGQALAAHRVPRDCGRHRPLGFGRFLQLGADARDHVVPAGVREFDVLEDRGRAEAARVVEDRALLGCRARGRSERQQRRRGRIAQEFSSRLHPVLRSACRQPALSACFGARPGRGNPERAIVLQPRRALVSQQGAADFT